MVSDVHEVLLNLLRGEPRIVANLVQQALDVRLPSEAPTVVDSTLNQLTPTERQADLVVKVGKSVGIVVEVQLGIDKGKRISWPVYLSNLRARDGGQVYLLVVIPSKAVAKWASQPIELGQPGFTLRPFVLRPGSLPTTRDLDVPKEQAALTILSALLLGKQAKPDMRAQEYAAALAATRWLDRNQANVYADLILRMAGKAAPMVLEAVMSSVSADGYEYKSEFAKKYFTEGREEGREEGRAESVLMVLEARGIEVSDDQRQAIRSMADLDTLNHWVRLAASASSAEELLASSPPDGANEDA